MVYRVNVGGRSIPLSEDTGMFREWSPDDEYLSEYKQLGRSISNSTIELKFTKIPAYTAPDEVYRSAQSMGPNKTINKSYNFTWEFPVDYGLDYLVRLQFCEIQPEITQPHDRAFLIFIPNQSAEEEAEVIKWSGGNGVPVYKDIFIWQVEQLLYENVEYQGNIFFRMSNFNIGPMIYCTSRRMSYYGTEIPLEFFLMARKPILDINVHL
jgi:hypothetical protein